MLKKRDENSLEHNELTCYNLTSNFSMLSKTNRAKKQNIACFPMP